MRFVFCFFKNELQSHSRGLINLTLTIGNLNSEDKHNALKNYLFGSLLPHLLFLLLRYKEINKVLNKIKTKATQMFIFAVTAKRFNSKALSLHKSCACTWFIFLPQGRICQLKKKLVSRWNWNFFTQVISQTIEVWQFPTFL